MNASNRDEIPSAIAAYRKRNLGRRFDFYASQDVADIIRYHQRTGEEKVLAGVIDRLILAGHNAIAGKKDDVGG